jgi:hypothetical protein
MWLRFTTKHIIWLSGVLDRCLEQRAASGCGVPQVARDAVCVLLAAARNLVRQPPARSVALLFTAAEERGLKG